MKQFMAVLYSILLAVSANALAEDMPVFKLTIQQGRFIPETIEVPAGIRFKLLISNLGPGPEEFESYELKKESVLGEGAVRPMVLAPLKPGMYPFFGEFHMDTAKGRIVAK